MRVLITGAAGYIGSRLCTRLTDWGDNVTAVDNFRYGNETVFFGPWPYLEVFREDVAAPGPDFYKALDRADAVVHLAALVGAPVCDRNPVEARRVNFDAVGILLDLLKPSQRLVFANTNSGYGFCETEATETTPMRPLSLYAETKCEAERLVLSRPNSVSLRLATVFGVSPRMRFDLMVNDFVRGLMLADAEGGEFAIYEPHFVRNAVHVEDATDAITHVLYRSRMSGAYNVALSEGNLTKRELADKIVATLGLTRVRVVEGGGKDPDGRNCRVSSDRLTATGFEYRRTLEHGIREVAALCRWAGAACEGKGNV